jgi:hypothetical protein
VERHHPHRPRDPADELLEAALHLVRGAVRERDREHLVRLHAEGAELVDDPVREDARLPGAGARDDEDRAFGRRDGLPLGRVQVGEVVLRGLGDGHAPMLDARRGPEAVLFGRVRGDRSVSRCG